jgi:hypothetical protein
LRWASIFPLAIAGQERPSAEGQSFRVWGPIRTPATKSWAEAQSWVARHPPNSLGRFLYDLSGPGVRFAEEPVWTLYPMGRIVLVLGLTACSALFLATTERRLRD